MKNNKDSTNPILVGFIPEKLKISNTIITLEPLENHKEIMERVKSEFHIQNGFCFPYLENKKYKDKVEEGNIVRELVSKGPPFQPEMFQFIPTHSFQFYKHQEPSLINNFTVNPSFFLLQVIAFIPGYRIMPEMFWFDGKLPMNSSNNVICNKYDLVLEKAHLFWTSLPPEGRKDILGIFYFFNRSRSYHWPFERFSHDFMVFDSAMKFYSTYILKSRFEKNRRYEHFLDLLKLNYDKDKLLGLAELRNDLFHEIKWGDGAPGLFEDGEIFEETFRFRRLLLAVLGRVLGLDGKFFENKDWGTRGTFLFDVNE